MPTKVLTHLAASLALSACIANTDGERAIVGAAGGAVAGELLSGDPLTGAVIGGAAGYFCDELNVPGCRRR